MFNPLWGQGPACQCNLRAEVLENVLFNNMVGQTCSPAEVLTGVLGQWQLSLFVCVSSAQKVMLVRATNLRALSHYVKGSLLTVNGALRVPEWGKLLRSVWAKSQQTAQSQHRGTPCTVPPTRTHPGSTNYPPTILPWHLRSPHGKTTENKGWWVNLNWMCKLCLNLTCPLASSIAVLPKQLPAALCKWCRGG